MPLPNFLICGAHKAGTTSLYHYLKNHPNIFMSNVKEIHFFTEHYKKGVKWYEGFFSRHRGQKAIGEASTSYMSNQSGAKHIFEILPQIKLVFLIRNPVERAYSHYFHRVQVGLQNPHQSFSELIRSDKEKSLYLEEGYYYKHIRRFLSYFKRDRLYFIISEELKEDTKQQVSGCLKFLGVDPNAVFDYNERYNVTMYPLGFALFKLLCRIWKPCKKHLWKITPSLLKDFKVIFHRKLLSKKIKPPMNQEDRFYLNEVYRKSNRELGDFLGVDLSFWEKE